MRPLEGLILLAILFSLLAYLVPKSRRPRWLCLLPALAALFVVVLGPAIINISKNF